MTLVRNPSWRATDDPCALPSPTASSWWATMRRSSSGRWRAATWTSCSTTSLRRRSCSGTRTIPLRPLIQTTTGSVFFSFATFNLALPPFDDIAVRRAVAFAMDRAAMAETIDPEPAYVAQHFASDTTEASLLASWSTIPGPDGQGDVGAASRRWRSRAMHPAIAAPIPSVRGCRS